MVFRKDDCRVRRGRVARNFSALRQFALSLLRQDTQYPKRSLYSQRQTADHNVCYRAYLLGLQPRGKCDDHEKSIRLRSRLYISCYDKNSGALFMDLNNVKREAGETAIAVIPAQPPLL